jgi:putative sterol carrier protein
MRFTLALASLALTAAALTVPSAHAAGAARTAHTALARTAAPADTSPQSIFGHVSALFSSRSCVTTKAKYGVVWAVQVTHEDGTKELWVVDARDSCEVHLQQGRATPTPNESLFLSDDTLIQLAEGKINIQKLFMTGKIKTKGNVMLTPKFGDLLKEANAGA